MIEHRDRPWIRIGLRRLDCCDWISRSIAFATVLLILGLLLPHPSTDAAQSSRSWDSGTVYFERKGDWSSVPNGYRNAVLQADNERADNTRWNPSITASPADNGIYWGNDEDPWAGRRCTPPVASGDAWGKECKRFVGTRITNSEIMMNAAKTWDSGRVQGIMTHELGHSGGLTHDPVYTSELPDTSTCQSTNRHRWTMCSKFTESNASWAKSTERHDRDDADAMYP